MLLKFLIHFYLLEVMYFQYVQMCTELLFKSTTTKRKRNKKDIAILIDSLMLDEHFQMTGNVIIETHQICLHIRMK